jgi:hypothetical protein
MSLAMTAAPFNNDNENSQNNDFSDNYSLVNKKRKNNHNKTQKRQNYDFDQEKVNSVLNSIHNTTPDSDSDNLGDYNPNINNSSQGMESFKPLNPIKPPISAGTERTKEGFRGGNNYQPELTPQPLTDENYELQSLKSAFMTEQQANDYYRKIMSNNGQNKISNDNNKNYYNFTQFEPNNLDKDSTNKVLLEKLNYMINLLEEQQDERTNHVTEEVILYSFLGIFMIFIVDSFARVGKYVR